MSLHPKELQDLKMKGIRIKKVKFRIGMMCDLSSEYDSKLVSEIELPYEEAKALEPFKNQNDEIILMGRGVGFYER